MFLLSPQIPLLFMGEDWGTKKPFQFFVDFASDPNLAKSVREGRRKEFAGFKAFESNSIEAIPDPTASETFRRSKLDWNEKSIASFQAIAETTKHLLNLRSTFIVPLLKSGFESSNYQRIETGGLRVTWIFAAGSLHFLANFGPGELTLPYHFEGQILWSNLGRDELILRRDETISLKPWLGLISKGNQA
jgi:maltooligosyltrehalose trehalohydrolase